MSGFQGAIFIILLIVIIIGIIAIKFVYDLWATSVTVNLLKNNSGALSGQRIIIWLVVIGIIAMILGFLGRRRQAQHRY
jgi:hypothetical protein